MRLMAHEGLEETADDMSPTKHPAVRILLLAGRSSPPGGKRVAHTRCR